MKQEAINKLTHNFVIYIYMMVIIAVAAVDKLEDINLRSFIWVLVMLF